VPSLSTRLSYGIATGLYALIINQGGASDVSISEYGVRHLGYERIHTVMEMGYVPNTDDYQT